MAWGECQARVYGVELAVEVEVELVLRLGALRDPNQPAERGEHEREE